MSSVLLVDWLGRGGIAQTTAAWATALDAAGRPVQVVTRAGRELADLVSHVVGADDRRSPVLAHRAVARAAVRAIREHRPGTVVVQNYVLPILERPVYDAAVGTGARLVVVVHNHKSHAAGAGTSAGFGHLLGRADVIAAHSRFVASGVRRRFARQATVMDLALPPASLGREAIEGTRERLDRGRMAVHFGVLQRRYKGTNTVVQLATEGVPGWRFTLVGAGAPAALRGARTVPYFVTGPELAGIVGDADAAVLPYAAATQSGAVALAQALGTVPVASDVGGISEQIADGRTGRLVPAQAGPQQWRRVLEELAADAPALAEMGANARLQAAQAHARFVATALELTA